MSGERRGNLFCDCLLVGIDGERISLLRFFTSTGLCDKMRSTLSSGWCIPSQVVTPPTAHLKVSYIAMFLFRIGVQFTSTAGKWASGIQVLLRNQYLCHGSGKDETGGYGHYKYFDCYIVHVNPMSCQETKPLFRPPSVKSNVIGNVKPAFLAEDLYGVYRSAPS